MPKTSRVLTQELPEWLTAALIGGTLATILWLENRRPLRRQTESTLIHNARNLAVAALSAAAIRRTERPVITRLTQFVECKRWGLMQRFELPAWLEVALSVVLLDYMLYVWHVLTHKIPLLWRFHRVHHADLD